MAGTGSGAGRATFPRNPGLVKGGSVAGGVALQPRRAVRGTRSGCTTLTGGELPYAPFP